MSERWSLTEEAEPVPPATITLVQGPSFVICDTGGDIDAARVGGVEGLFVGDTRVCSRLLMRLDGRRLEALAMAPQSPFAASFVCRTTDRALLVFRDLWIGRGMRADVLLRNLTDEPRSVAVRVDVDADLADVFAVKEGRSNPVPVVRTAAMAPCRSPARTPAAAWSCAAPVPPPTPRACCGGGPRCRPGRSGPPAWS